MRILVIDDELGYRDMLQMDLTSCGFGVAIAENGARALEILSRDSVDLILTDMKMPGMDGLDVVLAVKKAFPAIPIVLMTGYALGERVQRALSAKAAACLRKPFETQELTSVIRGILPA